MDLTRWFSQFHKREKYVTQYCNPKDVHALAFKLRSSVEYLCRQNWREPYIDYNTDKRKAESKLKKEVFKLMNNSVVGNTMEHVKTREERNLTTQNKQATKICSH